MVSWAGETTLDVEYAHALAPGASILLVETPTSENEGTSGFPQIVTAEEYVINHGLGAVISQSFSATEETFAGYAQIEPLRAAYLDADRHHVTVLAASGDQGATDYTGNGSDFYTRRVTSWPDSDPLVTGVGGTQLTEYGASYASVAWNDTYDQASDEYWGGSTDPDPLASGGGTSEYFTRPSYQNGVEAVTGARRGVPDIAMSAACDGAVNVYSSFANGPAGWSLTCGTSEATPEFAAIVALADQVAGHPLGLLNPTLYALLAEHAPGLVDVTAGNNTVSFHQGAKANTVAGYQAVKGYNLVTGVGTVNAAKFVYELAGVPVPYPPGDSPRPGEPSGPLRPVSPQAGPPGALRPARPRRPDQVGQPRRVDGLVGCLQLGHRPPAGRVDAVAGVHGGHVAERAQLIGHPADEVVVGLADQPRRAQPEHRGMPAHLGRRHRHIGPAGLLGQLTAGGRVEILVRLDPAARRGPVPALRRRVVVEEEQYSPGRIDRDDPSRQPHGVLRFTHATNYPGAVRCRACLNMSG